MKQREKNLINLLFPEKVFRIHRFPRYYHERVPMGLSKFSPFCILLTYNFPFSPVFIYMEKPTTTLVFNESRRGAVCEISRPSFYFFFSLSFIFFRLFVLVCLVEPQISSLSLCLTHFHQILYWKIFKSNRCSNET